MKMKNLIFTKLAIMLSVSFALSQPSIQWQKCLGGTEYDEAFSIQKTNDGGYIFAGWSFSNDGDVSGNHYNADYWVVKLNSIGTIEWQKSFGGFGQDNAYSIQQTDDGGYIVAGESSSNDGDAEGNHGLNDYWVLKLSIIGTIEWQKSLGGSGYDKAYSIQQTDDGGYIVAGESSSNDGDVSGNHGGYNDCWVVKLNSLGTIVWQKSIGGLFDDSAKSIQQTSDGGYIVAGSSDSNDGDVSGNHGGKDYWVVKLTTIGTIEWQKSLGGSGEDFAESIQQANDGGYIVAGWSSSNDGDVSGNHGYYDNWVLKLTSIGTIEWQNSIGGSGFDFAYSIQQTNDGGYIVASISNSNDGDVTGNHGSYDSWVVKLTSIGTVEWQKTLGGTVEDYACSIQQTNDGGYIVAGFTYSNDVDVSGSHGDVDCWVVKLTNSQLSIENKEPNSFSVFPNPAQNTIHVKADNKLIGKSYEIYDNTGKVILSGKINSENTIIEIGNLTGGIYLLSVEENLQQTFKIIKE
jgi:hypothetical protein